MDEERVHSSRIEKWVIDHSNYLFRYSYQDLQFDHQHLLYNYAKNAKKLVIIDLTSQETVCSIKNSISKLSPDKQYIKHQLDNGLSEYTIMCNMGLKVGQFRRKIVQIPDELSRYATERFYEQIGRNTPLPSSICSIMDFHPMTPVSEEKIQALKQMITILVYDFGITLFVVEQSMCSSKMVSVIKGVVRSTIRYDSKRTPISGTAPYLGPKKWGKVKDKYVPAFNSVLPLIPRGTGPEQKRRFRLLYFASQTLYFSTVRKTRSNSQLW